MLGLSTPLGLVASGLLALSVLLAAPAAFAQDGPAFEQLRFRYAIFQQEGRGVQSQARPDADGRGSEHAWIMQPIASFRMRQDASAVHTLTVPVDIVTSASTDALDAVSSASRENEAASLDAVSTVELDSTRTLSLHYGGHAEEYWGTGFLGVALSQSLADENATLRTGFEIIHDSFDQLQPNGFDPGPVVSRFTASVHGALSQLLSPTTIVSGGYTFTAQFGHLETSYNSTVSTEGVRFPDRFPRRRGRHVFTAEIRQAIPALGTFLSGSYRFYVDSFDAMAHTLRAVATQYIGDLWLRGHYRFHTQTPPSFWASTVDPVFDSQELRTADSDLEAFDAHELGVSTRWFVDRQGALTARSTFLELSYLHYWRSNSLRVHVGSLEFGVRFD